MTLLTLSQLAAIRELGVMGMSTTVTIKRYLGLTAPSDYEDPTHTWETTGTEVQGWLRSNMGRDFEEDGNRIVAVHDFTLRVPVGTAIDSRDACYVEGVEYTVVETNLEDTWPEWTVCYLKKVA